MTAFLGAPLTGAMAAARVAYPAHSFLGAEPTEAARNLRGVYSSQGADASSRARRGARRRAGAIAAGAPAAAGVAASALAARRRLRPRRGVARRAAAARGEAGAAEAAALEREAARLRAEAIAMEQVQAEARRAALARRLLSQGAEQAPLPGLGEAALPGRLKDACEFEAPEAAVRALFEACGLDPASAQLTFDELSSQAFQSELDSLISADRAHKRQAQLDAREQARKESAGHRENETAQVDVATPVEENNDRGAVTRLVACLAYLLPLSDFFLNGVPLVDMVPLALPLFLILAVPAGLLHCIPFGSLIVFFIMSSCARNVEMPRLLRFNFQQAVVLDVLLAIPSFLVRMAGLVPGLPGSEIGISSAILLAVYIVLLAACVYAIGRTLIFGEDPDGLPTVSDATRRGLERGL